MASVTPAGVWVKASQTLKGELGDDTFGSWLAQACLRTAPGGELCLVTPTGIARDWIRRYAWRRIGELWALYDPRGPRAVAEVAARVRGRGRRGAAVASAGLGARARSRSRPPIRSPPTARPPRRSPPRRPTRSQWLQERFTFDSFVNGPVERVRPGGRPPGRVLGRRPFQPGRLPWRLRLREDPPAQRHRLGSHAHRRRRRRWSTSPPSGSFRRSSGR